MEGMKYLGDGVYMTFDGYHLCLYANDPTSDPVIYLEPFVFAALIREGTLIFAGAQHAPDPNPAD